MKQTNRIPVLDMTPPQLTREYTCNKGLDSKPAKASQPKTYISRSVKNTKSQQTKLEKMLGEMLLEDEDDDESFQPPARATHGQRPGRRVKDEEPPCEDEVEEEECDEYGEVDDEEEEERLKGGRAPERSDREPPRKSRPIQF
jgi:hypothetical protein